MSNFSDVKHFMTVFGQDVPIKPTVPNIDVIKLRIKLILEETQELVDAVTIAQWDSHPVLESIKQGFEGLNNDIQSLTQEDFDVDMVGAADAFTDIEYVTLGGGVAFGIDLDDTFNEVHSSNMSKLDANGKPIRNEFGKVQKSELYRAPNLLARLVKQGYQNASNAT